jgi:serine protease Do
MKSSHLHISRWVATVAVIAALVCGGVLAIGLRNWSDHPVFGAAPLNITLARNEAPVSLGEFANGFSSVLKPVLPAVVNIHSSRVVKPHQDGAMPFSNDPFFQQFFGNQFGQQQMRPEREQSLGSGVIITSDGTILTNNHVIDGATDIEVQLSDKREFKAKLVGTDPRTDVAVLKIDASGLPTLAIGDSSRLQVGDMIFAVGDPFGVGETATMGIVSATGRSGLGIENYEDFIQTDAPINPGNSGGAMIDLHGNLIGINTAIATGGGEGSVGIGFAIPINMARSVMDQLVSHGKVVRGYLGLVPQDVTPQIAKQFGLTEPGGALIGEISPDSPAAKAGLKRGDVILKVNGDSVNSANDLRLRISQSAPGTNVKLDLFRDGKNQNVDVTLGELPEKEANATPGESSNGGLQGINVQDLTPDLAQQLNLPGGTHGVVVSDVDPASPAAADLQRGDVIQEVNHKSVSNVDQYKQALSGAGNQPVLLLVDRGGVTQYIVVETH